MSVVAELESVLAEEQEILLTGGYARLEALSCLLYTSPSPRDS